MSSKRFEYTVPKEFDGKDARTFLRQECGLSSHILTILRKQESGIMRNGQSIRTIDKLNGGDVIVLSLPEDKNEILPTAGELKILYEDNYLLAVDKPANLTVHPTKQHQLDTLANIVTHYMKERAEIYTFRTPYRLDRDTSGVVLIAKDMITFAGLKGIQKNYTALCHGSITHGATINAPIALRPDSKMVRCVSDRGQRAITHYEPIRQEKGYTLLSLTLETGRTHQIRCHMSAIGHPLLGDDLYGGETKDIARHALHCESLTFTHPITRQQMTLSSPIPEDMLRIIQK